MLKRTLKRGEQIATVYTQIIGDERIAFVEKTAAAKGVTDIMACRIIINEAIERLMREELEQ